MARIAADRVANRVAFYFFLSLFLARRDCKRVISPSEQIWFPRGWNVAGHPRLGWALFHVKPWPLRLRTRRRRRRRRRLPRVFRCCHPPTVDAHLAHDDRKTEPWLWLRFLHLRRLSSPHPMAALALVKYAGCARRLARSRTRRLSDQTPARLKLEQRKVDARA